MSIAPLPVLLVASASTTAAPHCGAGAVTGAISKDATAVREVGRFEDGRGDRRPLMAVAQPAQSTPRIEPRLVRTVYGLGGSTYVRQPADEYIRLVVPAAGRTFPARDREAHTPALLEGLGADGRIARTFGPCSDDELTAGLLQVDPPAAGEVATFRMLSSGQHEFPLVPGPTVPPRRRPPQT